MSDFNEISRDPLRMKGMPMKKKKKKNKEKELKHVNASDLNVDSNKSSNSGGGDNGGGGGGISEKKNEEIQLTKAELSFLKKQEKLQLERVLQKAAKSHRQLVEEFNNKLDNMSEHYDIPKVSWTK